MLPMPSCGQRHLLGAVFLPPLAVHIQTSRALMVISLLLGFFGIIVSVVGMKCTKVGEEDPVTKSRIAVAGGVLFILSGKAALAFIHHWCRNPQTPFNTDGGRGAVR